MVRRKVDEYIVNRGAATECSAHTTVNTETTGNTTGKHVGPRHMDSSDIVVRAKLRGHSAPAWRRKAIGVLSDGRYADEGYLQTAVYSYQSSRRPDSAA